MKCPICGFKFREGWSQCDEGHVFEQSTDTLVAAGAGGGGGSVSVPAGVTVERRRPARAADLISDVVVPAVQALITGLLVMIGTGTLAALLGMVWAWVPDALPVGGVAGFIGMARAWYLLLQEHRDLLWEIETRTGRDLDGDGKVGRPKPKKETTPIEVHIPPGVDQKGKRILFMNLPASPEKLRIFARGVLNGQPTTEGAWSGSGRLFSKPVFIRLRDELIERKLAAWRDPEAHAQGWFMLSVGQWVLRQLAEEGT